MITDRMFLITDLTGQIFVLKEKRRRKCKSVSDSANIKTAAVFSKLYLCQGAAGLSKFN